MNNYVIKLLEFLKPFLEKDLSGSTFRLTSEAMCGVEPHIKKGKPKL